MTLAIYEMRSYRVDDGCMVDELVRGLDCILTREEGGTGLFGGYGSPRPVGLWRLLTGPHLPPVVFLYRWPSVAARSEAFEAFYDDSEWQALRATSNAGPRSWTGWTTCCWLARPQATFSPLRTRSPKIGQCPPT